MQKQIYSPREDDDRDQQEGDKRKLGKGTTGLSLGGLTGSGQKKKEPLASAIYIEDDDDDQEGMPIKSSFVFLLFLLFQILSMC